MGAAWDETKKRADPYDEPVTEFVGELVDEVKGTVDDFKKPVNDVDVHMLRLKHRHVLVFPNNVLRLGKFLDLFDPLSLKILI